MYTLYIKMRNTDYTSAILITNICVSKLVQFRLTNCY